MITEDTKIVLDKEFSTIMSLYFRPLKIIGITFAVGVGIVLLLYVIFRRDVFLTNLTHFSSNFEYLYLMLVVAFFYALSDAYKQSKIWKPKSENISFHAIRSGQICLIVAPIFILFTILTTGVMNSPLISKNETLKFICKILYNLSFILLFWFYINLVIRNIVLKQGDKFLYSKTWVYCLIIIFIFWIIIRFM